MSKQALDLVRRLKAYQAHVAGKPNQDRFIELCDELFAALGSDETEQKVLAAMQTTPISAPCLRGLPMSAIKVGMKLRRINAECWPVITVTEITDKGFKYSHPRHSFGGGRFRWSEGGEDYGQEGYSFYELAEQE